MSEGERESTGDCVNVYAFKEASDCYSGKSDHTVSTCSEVRLALQYPLVLGLT